MKFSTYSFKQLLSGGLLCCLILLAAYIFQAFFPGMYVDAFSSSMHLLMWLTLFVGALLWTFHEKGETFGISEVIDWQFIAAFILITADEIYMIMPREIHMEIAPVLNAKGDINRRAASLKSQKTGIVLDVYTNEPGVQVYAGNFLDGSLTGKKGITYNQRASVCLETQKYPDTPNKPEWPSAVLRPGEKYMSQCIFKFSVDK
jgi:hypothetical protein